ncbi:MFS transporter [Bradyrhizobium sp. S69]|uniref:MFS transporter n=1 Tax=Bradyrhizobium sp. S69 TaxID=1641856 RepID=UPI001FEEBF45|nr:MFS transporter [Bradyrhizobium sp. S69]
MAFARAIQGLGAAGIMSQNGALVRFTYPSKMLGRGLGLNALVASAGAALGPTLASGILAMASWQWCHSACNIDPLSRGIGVQN